MMMNLTNTGMWNTRDIWWVACLCDVRVRKRKEFEDQIRRRRYKIPIWLQYAAWEAEQTDFRRGRSVYERALEVDYQNPEIWNAYLDMEIKNEFINFARNLFDRVTHLMPRIDHFWLRYAAFEEALQMYSRVRQIFERWMEWHPDDRAWMAYVKFEERCEEYDRARKILERFLVEHPNQQSFLKFAKWETEQGNYTRARAAFEKALQVLPSEEISEKFYLKFAQFEEQRREPERARAVFQEGIRQRGASVGSALEAAYISYQKRLGSREGVESIVLDQRRRKYEQLIEESSGYDYDAWFCLIRLLQEVGVVENIRGAYERAVKIFPPIMEKSQWKRYFYIYLSYCTFEELTAQDMEKAAAGWEQLALTIPHKQFSFAKFWKLWADFEIRRHNVTKARLIYGRAIAEYPVEKVFKAYADMEMRLGEINRVRKVCAKFIETQHTNPRAWLSLIDLELLVKERERAIKLFEQAISREDIVNVEVIWKAYIDVETNLHNLENARSLFERLFQKTGHWKVLLGLADFEWKTTADIEASREIYKRGIKYCKQKSLDAERCSLIEWMQHWLNMEKGHGEADKVEEVAAMVPKKVKKRRTIVAEDGSTTAVEEYTAYVFADEADSAASLAILEAARAWKKKKMEQQQQVQTSVV